MYTALPTRLHITQVRQSGTCTHTHIHVHIPYYKTTHTAGTCTHTHIHVHSPAYKTAHMAGVCKTKKNTSTCTLPCLQDRTYGRYAGQRRAHTHTHTCTQPCLQDRIYGRYASQGRAHTHTCTQPCLQDRTYGRYTGQSGVSRILAREVLSPHWCHARRRFTAPPPCLVRRAPSARISTPM